MACKNNIRNEKNLLSAKDRRRKSTGSTCSLHAAAKRWLGEGGGACEFSPTGREKAGEKGSVLVSKVKMKDERDKMSESDEYDGVVVVRYRSMLEKHRGRALCE